MIIVTGGAGFIGGALVEELNRRGRADILVVDNLKTLAKQQNLARLEVMDAVDKVDFREAVRKGAAPGEIEVIFHQGACSDTMHPDDQYVMDNNLEYSRELLRFALEREVPLVYASSAAVYGDSCAFAEAPENEQPLSAYALSKQLFDVDVLQALPFARSPVVGLRYFNTYGPHEAHKGKMASMVYQFFKELSATGSTDLFEGFDGLAPGEQARDFVHVADVVRVNLHFSGLLDCEPVSGVFNVGTGRAWPFNQLAGALIQRLGRGRVNYVPVPAHMKDRYQVLTCADLTRLRQAGGYSDPFATLEQGIARSVEQWKQEPMG